jgi:hypothetical protein
MLLNVLDHLQQFGLTGVGLLTSLRLMTGVRMLRRGARLQLLQELAVSLHHLLGELFHLGVLSMLLSDFTEGDFGLVRADEERVDQRLIVDLSLIRAGTIFGRLTELARLNGLALLIELVLLAGLLGSRLSRLARLVWLRWLGLFELPRRLGLRLRCGTLLALLLSLGGVASAGLGAGEVSQAE